MSFCRSDLLMRMRSLLFLVIPSTCSLLVVIVGEEHSVGPSSGGVVVDQGSIGREHRL